ncbi:capsular biosynthesis protein [Enterovibrio baiacu]|uniref:capsular biosynthesis protein n=1 Tax=Enterovibrio baiacu TaxID=2491023 RepID=UPI003D14896B
MRKLIVDLDHTITLGNTSDYKSVSPNIPVIKQLRNYKNQGFEIVISTARNMRTYEGNVGKINIHTLPTIVAWLDEHNVPYDEILVGKPWCGKEGFYIDDRAIRPSEFASKTPNEINALLKQELEEIKKLCS